MGDGLEKIRMAEHSGEMSFIGIVPKCQPGRYHGERIQEC